MNTADRIVVTGLGNGLEPHRGVIVRRHTGDRSHIVIVTDDDSSIYLRFTQEQAERLLTALDIVVSNSEPDGDD